MCAVDRSCLDDPPIARAAGVGEDGAGRHDDGAQGSRLPAMSGDDRWEPSSSLDVGGERRESELPLRQGPRGAEGRGCRRPAG